MPLACIVLLMVETKEKQNQITKVEIPNGIFTIKSPSGEHRTFQVHTWKQKEGETKITRSIGLLVGERNTTDYNDFAFVSGSKIIVWKKFKGTQLEKFAALVQDMLFGSHYKSKGMEILITKNCMRCNRALTTPQSIEDGIGPECKQMMGL